MKKLILLLAILSVFPLTSFAQQVGEKDAVDCADIVDSELNKEVLPSVDDVKTKDNEAGDQ